jgi:GNAT superfamily N-acetyltransferase
MDDATLDKHLGRVAVFARIMPEASAIVLLDDDFGSIVEAIRLGRGIYDNIRKAMAFIFAVHVPLAGFAVLPLVFGLPILFGPIHIAFIEMIIDPVCALVFESEREEADIMNRKPRDPAQRLFSLPMVMWSVFQGMVAFGILATLFLTVTYLGLPEGDVRELSFLSLIVSIVALILVNRFFGTSVKEAFTRKNMTLRYILGAIAVALTLTIMIPPFRKLFKFGTLDWKHIATALALGGLLLILLELLKPFANRQMREQSVPSQVSVHGSAFVSGACSYIKRIAMSTQEWSKRLITRSGGLFDVRPAHVGDEEKLLELFAHVTPEDKAFRALTGHAGYIRINTPDHQPSKTFLALIDQQTEAIAAATLDCDIERQHGDVTLVIRSDFKHDGVSWALLAHIVRYARAIGVKSLESVEVPDNQAAIALEREMGFAEQTHPGNPALILMRKTLGETG